MPEPWLRCVDQIGGTGTYLLNPAHIVYAQQVDGWWRATDVFSRYHVIASDDDKRIEQLAERRRT